MSGYDNDFFQQFRNLAFSSARTIIPKLAALAPIRSVVDIGCGSGVWLAVCREHGCEVRGLDGDYIDRTRLEFPAESFQSTDLNRPIRLDRRYDLAISLEVAEHIEPENAGAFLDSLTAASDLILFSAAVPGQGGVHHVNEQWQDWWAARFIGNGYEPLDCLRSMVWNDSAVSREYAQNIVVYCSRALLQQNPHLRELRAATRDNQLAVVHPEFYERRMIAASQLSGRQAARALIAAGTRAARRAIRGSRSPAAQKRDTPAAAQNT